MKKITLKFLLVSLIAGCATNKPKVVEEKEPVKEVKEEVVSEHKAWALKAQEDRSDYGETSSILGSAIIETPNQYEGKSYFLFGAEHLNLDNYYFDIPVVYNRAVKKWMNYFLNRGRGFFARYGARAGRYAPVLGKILEEHGLPRDLIFLAMAESGFQTKAKSWAKAVGPWQFMPYTGRRYGLHIDWYIDERRDPIKATIAAAKYLKKLYGDFGSWELAAAAYNAGEGKMSRAIRRYKTENFWRIRRGRYLKPETKNYVPKIMALAILGKNLKAFGFEEIDFHESLDFEEVTVPGMTDLVELSKSMNVDFKEMQRLNPEILRWFTPPGRDYTLRVPVGMKVAFENCCQNDPHIASLFQNYSIRGRRTNLKDVAKKFKIKDPKVLLVMNDISGVKKRLKKGMKIKLPFREGQSKKAPMYADLYEKPRKSVLRRRKYKRRIRIAKKRGKRIANPKRFYVVKRGDSLWSVAKKTGISMDTIIASNLRIIQNRMIRAGDKLVIE